MAEQTPLVYVGGRTVRLPAADTVLAAVAKGAATDDLYKLRRAGGVYSWESDNSPTWVWQAANTAPNSTTTLSNTGLTFPVVANGTYWFSAEVHASTNAVGTGIRIVPNGPTAPFVSYTTLRANSGTALVTAFGQNIFQQPGTASAGVGASLQTEAVVRGVFRVTAAGTFAIQFASEAAGAAVTVYAGSNLQYRRIS